jgi:hypothetical protein
LVALRLWTEKGADFVKGEAKACRGMAVFEPTHRATSLLDSPMVLLQMVVQIAVGPVQHPVPEDVPNGQRIGIMTIRRDPVRHHPSRQPCRPKEGLGRCKVPGITEVLSDFGKWPVRKYAKNQPCALAIFYCTA